MSPGSIVLAAAIVLAVIVLGLYLSMTAGRLDHLHQRIDQARLALDAHLLRRSSVATELAASGLLDPASALVVADAAHGARRAADADALARARAESDLTAALAVALDDAEAVADARSVEPGPALLDELDAACRRVELSRRFLNDAVRACRRLRGQRLVRWFRLAGRTPLPDPWEMDDSIPPGMAR